jgi:hypothetical protein
MEDFLVIKKSLEGQSKTMRNSMVVDDSFFTKKPIREASLKVCDVSSFLYVIVVCAIKVDVSPFLFNRIIENIIHYFTRRRYFKFL